jgi:hypothetical protein
LAVSSPAADYDLLIGELKDTHLTVPEDTSKHEDDFHQIQRSCGTPSVAKQSESHGEPDQVDKPDR